MDSFPASFSYSPTITCRKSVLSGPSWTKDVAVLRSSSRPFVALRGQKMLQFFAVLRGPSWPSVDKRCCSCSSSRPFVALRGQKMLQLQFFVALRGPPRTKGLAVAVLRNPPRPSVHKKYCRCSSAVALLQLQFFVVLRGPSRPFVDKRGCSCSCSNEPASRLTKNQHNSLHTEHTQDTHLPQERKLLCYSLSDV